MNDQTPPLTHFTGWVAIVNCPILGAVIMGPYQAKRSANTFAPKDKELVAVRKLEWSADGRIVDVTPEEV